MTPISSIEGSLAGQDLAVKRTDQAAGSRNQSRSSAESPELPGKRQANARDAAEKAKAAANKALEAALRRSKAREKEAEEHAPPPEPVRVVEIQLFAAGKKGKPPVDRKLLEQTHIDLRV